MPHLILEYTDSLHAFDVPATLRALNGVLVETGLFPVPDLKARAIKLDTYVVGAGDISEGFAALTLHTRLNDAAKKAAIAADLLATLKACVPSGAIPVQYSVDIKLIDPACYAKDRVGP